MKRKRLKAIASLISVLVLILAADGKARAQGSPISYSEIAPIDEYLMGDRNAEIALARNAAPEAISRDAKILILGRHGYETAIEGKNGLVCVVERSWISPFDRPEVMLTSQFKDAPPIYVFIVPVGRWSDGAPTPVM